MRPATLAQAYERIAADEPREAMLAEFLDTFYLAPSAERQLASISDEPRLTGDERLDALAGAIAEYLAKQNRLPKVPDCCRAAISSGHGIRLLSPTPACANILLSQARPNSAHAISSRRS